MQELATRHQHHATIHEVDITHGEAEDLTIRAIQEHWLSRIRAHEFHAILVTPPCSTFSRVRMSNKRGPPPLRCAAHPRGFPWASNKYKAEVDCGNIMADFMVETVRTATALRPQPGIFVEHPEDLGAVVREEDRAVLHPASIWQWPEVKALCHEALFTVAITQCC